jgi:hypothetical protein
MQRKAAAVLGAGTVAAAALAFGAGSASAVAPGAVGQIAYVSGGNLYVANPDGTGAHAIVTGGVSGTTAWFSSGTRVAYVQNGNLFIAQYDGSNVQQISTDGKASNPAPQEYQVRSGQAILGYADNGSLCWGEMTTVGFSNYCPGPGSDPASYASQKVPGGGFYVDSNGYLTLQYSPPSSIKASSPDANPDVTEIVYADPASGQIFSVPISFDANYNAIYGTPVQVTADGSTDADPRFSPDGKEITYTNGGNVMEIAATAVKGTGSVLIPNASGASWQPVNGARVIRAWGSNAIETAIAVSQLKYKTVGDLNDPRAFAKGVVLSRSDQYYDALAGSAFAASQSAPLLMTHTASLDAPVLAEIERMLPKAATVYLLGGTAAISPEVETQLRAAGYTNIQRFAGANMYATAVLIDKAEFPQGPAGVMVATGSNYYDALAASAVSIGYSAVGLGNAAIVLAKGGVSDASLPAESLDYLNEVAPTSGSDQELIGVGGPGYNAIVNAENAGGLANWKKNGFLQKVVGSNAVDTAVKLAGFKVFSSGNIGLATTGGWQDALAGGAFIGSSGGVLLLTGPTGLNAEDASFLAKDSISIKDVDVFGGPAALPDSIITAINPLIGVPGSVQDISFQPGDPAPTPMSNSIGSAARARAAKH